MHVRFDRQYQPWLAVDPRSLMARAHIYLDPAGFLVASDSYIMAVVPCEIDGAGDGFAGCLLPADGLKQFARSAKKLSFVPLEIDLERQIVSSFGVEKPLPPQSRFPEWRRVVPAIASMDDEPTPPPYLALDPWLMARVALAIGREKDTPIAFLANTGEQPMVIANGPALGVIMPGDQRNAQSIRPFVHEMTDRLSNAHGRQEKRLVGAHYQKQDNAAELSSR